MASAACPNPCEDPPDEADVTKRHELLVSPNSMVSKSITHIQKDCPHCLDSDSGCHELALGSFLAVSSLLRRSDQSSLEDTRGLRNCLCPPPDNAFDPIIGAPRCDVLENIAEKAWFDTDRDDGSWFR